MITLQLLVVALVCVPSAALAQEAAKPNFNVLSITGTGVVSAPADMASISLGVQFTHDEAVRAQRDVAASSSAVVAALQQLKVSKLHTTSVSLYPQYTSDMYGNSQMKGFYASNNIAFMVPADKAGEAIDVAIRAGANNVQSITFQVDSDLMPELKDKALDAAVDNALMQGSRILRKFGCTFHGYSGISLHSGDYAPTYSAMKMMPMMAADASTPVVSGENQVSASISVDLLYSDCSLALP